MGAVVAGQGAQRFTFGPRAGGPGRTATDTAIYHCQQAAEKALKGYLAFHDQPLERTHDLERLLELATALDTAFAALETQTDVLNPYATAFRYPITLRVQFPSLTEVNTAIEHAQAICDFVLRQIPGAAHPPANHTATS